MMGIIVIRLVVKILIVVTGIMISNDNDDQHNGNPQTGM